MRHFDSQRVKTEVFDKIKHDKKNSTKKQKHHKKPQLLKNYITESLNK